MATMDFTTKPLTLEESVVDVVGIRLDETASFCEIDTGYRSSIESLEETNARRQPFLVI